MGNTRALMYYDGNNQPTECGLPFHIADNTGHRIATGPALLLRIVSNQTGSADWKLSIYDGIDAGGTLIGVCDANNGGNYEFGVVLTNGLFIQPAGTTAGDVTVVYATA